MTMLPFTKRQTASGLFPKLGALAVILAVVCFGFSQAAMAAGGGGGMNFSAMVPFLLILPILYLFLVRPQQKKAKDHQALLKKLAKGDRVLTISGVFGIVSKLVNEKEIQVEVADGVKVTMLRSSIAQILHDPATKNATPRSSVKDGGASPVTVLPRKASVKSEPKKTKVITRK